MLSPADADWHSKSEQLAMEIRPRGPGGEYAAVVVVLATVATGCGGGAAGACADAALVMGEAPAGFPSGPIGATGPIGNALTEDRAQLGKQLFSETRLSRTGLIACASCHDQAHAFADPRPVSAGVDGRTGTRNAPTLVNLAWASVFFWDGRARTLEEQARQPIENPLEMDLPLADAVARLAADPAYIQAFELAYGSGPSEETVPKALASFVRTLVSGEAPYDRFLAGDSSALGPSAQRGEVIFFGKGGCFHCHPPGTLTNDGFFNNGTYVDGGDEGRRAITGLPGDLGKFKVPGLRNIAQTAPYMHDGSLATLEDVVDQYDRGGRGDASTDPLIEPLSLSDDDKRDLVSFLRSLTDDAFLVDCRFHR